jgi:hypothetical protein
MNAHNTQTNYMATGHAQPSTYATPVAESESLIDKAYILSLRGILKIACLVSASFIVKRNVIPISQAF